MQLLYISAVLLKLLDDFVIEFIMADMLPAVTLEILVLHRFSPTINAIVPINSKNDL